MKLSNKDAELFFKLMWSLQAYVNDRLKILPEIETLGEYEKLPSSEKIKVRNALYENIDFIDEYLIDNPEGFPKEELDIVRGWKKFKGGNYFVERFLKKYAIFIGGEKAYGVLAIYEPFEDVLPYPNLPYYTKAVLLPFKGRIIYDGLLEGYNVAFGSGIKYDLKEIYLAAKQKGEIIESFDSRKQVERPKRKKTPSKDWGPIINEISQQAKSLRSGSGSPAIHSPAFSLAKASIEFARLAVESPDDIDELWKALEKVERTIRKTEMVLLRS